MKANILIVATTDAIANQAIAYAAAQTGHRLGFATDSREACEMLAASPNDVDLLIVDLDNGVNRLSLLDAFRCSENVPPVIVLTQFEQSEMEPIARRHGAAACIAKPFSPSELAALVAELCPSTSQSPPSSCDLWGHPYPSHRRTSASRDSFANAA